MQAFAQKERGRARTPRKTPKMPKTASILMSWFRAWISLNLRDPSFPFTYLACFDSKKVGEAQ